MIAKYDPLEIAVLKMLKSKQDLDRTSFDYLLKGVNMEAAYSTEQLSHVLKVLSREELIYDHIEYKKGDIQERWVSITQLGLRELRDQMLELKRSAILEF